MTNGLSRILVPVDFGAASRRALRFARDLASKNGATVALVHVMPGRGLEPADDKRWHAYATRTLRGCAERAKVPASSAVVVLRGSPGQAVAEYAGREGIDLVVVSARDEPSWDGSYLGPNALGILRNSPVPVLVLPARRRKGRAAA